MSNAHDRRAPGAVRVPFEAMVEVGGALGPSFEAQAVNLSEEGMSLRTAYLPEVGQPVMCRFDAGSGLGVVAAGEVLWKDDLGDGGEFGIRFTNLDSPSTVALQRILGMAEDGTIVHGLQGRKVRLHIEGLASPMRARIKSQHGSTVTAYSELGFLQMGKPLDLEDAMSGGRRPAMIDHVAVEIDDASRIPQLVVSLRYDDVHPHDEIREEAAMGGHEVPAEEDTPRDAMPEAEAPSRATNPGLGEHAEAAFAAHAPATADEGEGEGAPESDGEGNKLKQAWSRGTAKVKPALVGWMTRAKIAAALLAAKAHRKTGDDVEIPLRRTTAPAPGGGLHAAGRKVVRGSVPDDRFEEALHPSEPRKTAFKVTKKKAAIAAAVGLATLLAILAIRKPAASPQLAAAPPADTTTDTNTAAPPGSGGPAKPAAPPTDPLAAAAAAMNKPALKATPFTNGPVGSHPTVLKIKMDGSIDGIQGAPQPTGFTVSIPNRKSLESTAALAEKDPRISSVSVSNEPTGAELSIAFKDGVPNYLVRAHGDQLEVVLAKGGPGKAEAHHQKKATKKHH